MEWSIGERIGVKYPVTLRYRTFCVCRIYWVCVLIASFIGMVVIFVYTIDAYANDAITINMDTAYSKWNNTFPAISFCMLRPFNPSAEYKIKGFIQKYYAEHNIKEPDQ